jgi:hypothetical protein
VEDGRVLLRQVKRLGGRLSKLATKGFLEVLGFEEDVLVDLFE